MTFEVVQQWHRKRMQERGKALSPQSPRWTQRSGFPVSIEEEKRSHQVLSSLFVFVLLKTTGDNGSKAVMSMEEERTFSVDNNTQIRKGNKHTQRQDITLPFC